MMFLELLQSLVINKKLVPFVHLLILTWLVKLCFDVVQVDDVLHQSQSLDVDKAAGTDGISAHFLRSVANDIASSLTVSYNMSLQTGFVPSAWKLLNVSPVHKG